MKRSVIYYLIDGARPDILKKLSDQGKLPNITKHLIENGSFVTATTCLPSTTGPAYLPMLTGHFPGEHDITGIRWFDKSKYFQTNRWNRNSMRSYCGYEANFFNDDMNPDMPSIFEEVDKGINIYNMITKGVKPENDVTKDFKTKLYFRAHFKHEHHPVDEAGHKALLDSLESNPDFVFAVFPSIDWDAHTYHYDDEKTHAAYQIVDKSLGEIVQRLKDLGRYKDTLIVMSSDHGLSSTHSHLDLGKYFKKQGYRVLEYPNILTIRPNLAISISGNSFASLNFLDQEEAHNQDSLDNNHGKNLEAFVQKDAIDFIIYRKDSNHNVVHGANGKAIVSSQDGLSYTIDSGDPLNIGKNVTQLSDQQAHEVTIQTDYPDSLFQITQLMNSHRAGDVLVCAAPGHDLRDFWEYPEHKGSHGSLHKEHMLMPLLTNKKDMVTHSVRSNKIHSLIKDWLS